jgi:hypothetical protein
MKAAALRFALVAALAGLGSAACSRVHITPTHGRAYREAFAAQDANPNRSKNPPKSINGLDYQEAAIIAGNYRKGLAPASGGGDNNGQLLLVAPQHGGGGAAALPPSVPSGM